MKKILFFILILIIINGCVIHSENGIIRGFGKKIKGTGNIITKTIDKKDFDSISVSNAINIKINKENSYGIKVKIDRTFINYFNAEVKNNTLYLYMKKGYSYTNINPDISIEMPVLEEIKLSGASDCFINNFEVTDLKLHTSGASDLKGTITGENLYIRASGASDLDLKGKFKYVDINVSGATDAFIQNIKAEKVDISASGASDVKVYASGEVDINLSGASDLDVYGSPLNEKLSVSGGADIDFK